MTQAWFRTVLAMGFALLLGGCGVGVVPNDLSSYTEDANNNGFPEIPPPEGVTFEEFGSVNVRLFNTLDEADVAAFAAQYGYDTSLLNMVALTVTLTLSLDYGNGITDQLQETRDLAPFDIPFELACPSTVTINITATATALGVSQPLLNESHDLTEGVDFQCGQTVEVGMDSDEAGNVVPVFEVS